MGKFLNTEFVERLSSKELAGRVPATEGHLKAQEMIIEKFKEYNLDYVMPDGWKQYYPAGINEYRQKITGCNLLAMKKAKVPTDEWVMLVAHYDHVRGSLGANDNAASVGMVFETMKYLENHDSSFNIVLGIFDTEEPPYFASDDMGSFYFYKNCPLDVDKLKFSFVLDLVGHEVPVIGKKNTVFAVGTDSAKGLFSKINEATINMEDINVVPLKRGFFLSDHIILDDNDKPYLFLSSGYAWHYHTDEDTFEKLDLEKMAVISEFMKNYIISLETPLDNVAFDKEKEVDGIANFLGMNTDKEKKQLKDMSIERVKHNLIALMASQERYTVQELKSKIEASRMISLY